MRPASVRVRTTAAAVAVVGLALIVAAVALVAMLGRQLTANMRSIADDRSDEVVAALVAGRDPDLGAGDRDDEFIQLVDDRGVVVASSANVDGLVAFGGHEAMIVVRDRLGPARFLVVRNRASLPGGSVTVVVGRTLDDVGEATGTASRLVAVGIPLLVLIVGAVTWLLTGWALSPVERMRAEVESISATSPERRIDEPATGDEIARLAATLNRMLGRLASAQARQRRFVSDAAHELRSPVAAIRQHAEVARAHPEQTSLPDLADVVLTEDLRVQSLVDDLLLLARFDEGAHDVTEEVDLDDLVFAEADRLRATTELEIDARAVAAARVMGRTAELAPAVRNLADNAARHARSKVVLTLSAGSDAVTLMVEDDGPGIAPEDRTRIFERFERLDEGRSADDGGSGLGLAIVHGAVVAHGGRVVAADRPGGGARFVVTLPAAGGSDGLEP